jgi:hypothetical protein
MCAFDVFACQCVTVCLNRCRLLTGASAAAMLIFILPSAFYIKLVKKESMKSVQKIGVRSRAPGNSEHFSRLTSDLNDL